MFGFMRTFSPLAETLGFVPLPPLYWVLLAGMLVTYMTMTHFIKMRLYRNTA